MPLQQFLAACANDLTNQSPIQVVTETAPNHYIYVGPDEFEAAYIDPEDPNQTLPPPTPVHTKNLTPLSRSLLNGGTVVTLDHVFLAKQKSQILVWASSWIGAGCIHLAKTVHRMTFQQLTSGTQIDNAIQSMSFGSNPDTTVLCNSIITSQLRTNLLQGRVRYQTSGRLQTNYFVDYYNPIYSPVVRDSSLMVFDWHNSFVLAAPRFSVQNNRLIFDFKMGIADTGYVHPFTV